MQGREQAGAPDGAGGGVGILAEVALVKLSHNGAVRRADGDGVDGSVQIDEAEEEPPLLAEHRVDLGHEADDVLDGVVPLALPREALQVVHAEEHGRLMEQPGSSAYVQRIDLRPNRIEAIRIWNKKGRESSQERLTSGRRTRRRRTAPARP